MRRRIRHLGAAIAAVAAGLICSILIHPIGRTVVAHQPERWPARSHFGFRDTTPRTIRLGLECPGVRLNLITMRPGPGQPLPTLLEFWSEDGGDRREIRQPGDLRGLVRINSPADALRYVRLGTTYPSRRYVSMGVEMEIISTDDLHAMPTFGLRPPFTRREIDQRLPPLGPSGTMGVLSPEAFRLGRFSRPEVRRKGDGFIVTRWLLSRDASEQALPHSAVLPARQTSAALPSPGDWVILVRETVGRDGSYGRRVIEMKPAPRLPYTWWQGASDDLPAQIE